MRQLRFWQRHSHWQECEDWIPLRAGTTVEARQRRRLLLDIVKTKFCIMYVNLQQPEIYATPRHATPDALGALTLENGWAGGQKLKRTTTKVVDVARPLTSPFCIQR